MGIKIKIDTMIKTLDEQYKPDDRFKSAINKTIEVLYSPTFPENQIDNMLELVKETYHRNYENKKNLSAAQENLKGIAQNLQEIRENYVKQMKGLAQINSSLEKIAQTAEPLAKEMQNQNEALDNAKKLLETNSTVLAKARRKLAEIKENLPANNNYKDPKKLN